MHPHYLEILNLCSSLACKSFQLHRGDITSRIKNINPYSRSSKVYQIIMDLENHKDTRYFTPDEFRAVKKEFRIKL